MARHVFCALFLSLLLTAAPAVSEPFPDPGIPDGQQHTYRVRYVGGNEERPNEIPYTRKATEHLTLLEYSIRIEQIDYKGRSAYKVIRSEKLKNGDRPVETLILLREPGGLFPAETRREHKDPSGRICKSSFVDLKAPSLKYPPDIVHYMELLAVGGAVAARPKGSITKFPLYLGDLNLVEGEAASMGPEKIKIGDKEIPALKLEISAQVTSYLGEKFWVKPLQKFIPKIYYWYSPEPPYPFLRFEGGLGGPGAPVEVDEMIE